MGEIIDMVSIEDMAMQFLTKVVLGAPGWKLKFVTHLCIHGGVEWSKLHSSLF